MTKYVLKAWLTDNPLTKKDLSDKYFTLEVARTIDNEGILDRMMSKNPGVRRETMALSLRLMEEVVSEALMNGEVVNTGIFHAVAKPRGKAVLNTWDVAKNSIKVSITQGKKLREAAKNTRVEILGERPANFYISSGQDVATRATDFSATAGRNFVLVGKNLTIAGDDPAIGITLKSVAKGSVTKIEPDMIVINGPTRLNFLLPPNLKEGEYLLTVTTQFMRGSKEFLKTPRSISHPLYIGKAPAPNTPGSQPGGSGSGGEGGGQSGNPLG